MDNNNDDELVNSFIKPTKRKGISMNVLEDMPDCLMEYIGIIDFMENYPGLYSMDDRRAKLHDEICEHYGMTKEKTKIITDNLHSVCEYFAGSPEKHIRLDSVHVALVMLSENRWNPGGES